MWAEDDDVVKDICIVAKCIQTTDTAFFYTRLMSEPENRGHQHNSMRRELSLRI